MVATDDDGCAHGTRPNELVEGEPCLRPLAVAQPADPGGQALERDLRLRHLDPAPKPGIVGEETQDLGVGAQDVGRVAGQGYPAKRPAALAELRPDEQRDEPLEVERVGHARRLGLRPDVVAVVEDDRTGGLHREHRPDVGRHPRHRAPLVHVRLRLPQPRGVRQGHLGRNVAAKRVVRGGLVGHRVEPFAATHEVRMCLRRVTDQRDAQRLARRRGRAGPRERLVRVVGEPIHEADLVPPACPRFVHLHADHHATVHRDRQRLGAAHPAKPSGEYDPSAQRPAEVLARQLGERLVGALEDPLGPDVDPGAGRHLAVHHQAGPLELAEVLPGRPLPHQVRVRDQHPGRPRVGPEDAHRLA